MNQMFQKFRKNRRLRTILSIIALILLVNLFAQGVLGVRTPIVNAHNLDASAVYIYFDPETQAMLDRRIDGLDTCFPSYAPPDPLLRGPQFCEDGTTLHPGDKLGLIIKAVPDNGTTTGVGGYTTFYIPNGSQVLDAAFLMPNSSGDYDRINAKGQALMPNIGAGGGPTVNLAPLGGLLNRGPNIIGVTAPLVNAANVNNGTLPGVYGDLGIFFSTSPQTAHGSYTGGIIRNNSGDTVGLRTPLGTPLNEWDAWQLAGFGIAGTTNPAYPTSPRIDSNGRGNTLWGVASAVAGPQSGYAWHFNKATYDACAGSPTGTITAACIEEATRDMGPWQRIQYPGSQIAVDTPGDTAIGMFVGGVDASAVGYPLSPSNPLPETTEQTNNTPNAIRFAFGQLTQNQPEFAWVQLRVTDFAEMLDPSGCPVWRVDTFGGDAGGDSNGKDHIWRYYDPNSIQLNGCLAAGKPATRDIVKVGDFYQYNLKLYNVGDVNLVNVVVTDMLPSGATFVSSVPTQNSGPNPLRWVVGSLPRGGKWEATVTVRASSVGILTNTMTVTGNTTDGDPVTTTVTDKTISGLFPYLRQNKSVTPASVSADSFVNYTVAIDNIGTGPTGSPIRILEYLPEGFTYDSLVSATINGAAVTPTVNATNPSKPIFTIPSSLQASRSLRLTLKVYIAPDVEPGSYCNSFTSSTPVNQTTGALACVTVAGGLIGDTIWYDWDGDGVQDPGELGIPGVDVTLYESDGTTVVAQTTTDANGNYFFPGLNPGDYVVRVDASNFDPGGPLAGFNQTFDPDNDVDDQHPITLSENQQYLLADFAYQPAGAGSIGDRVFEDLNDNGVSNAGEPGIEGVTVSLYVDIDGDGLYTPGVDAFVATTVTDADGLYSFDNLAEGFNYLVLVDPADSAIVDYFDDFYGPNTPYINTTLIPHLVTNLTGDYLLADFGFWKVEPGSIGDQVFIDVDGDGLYNPAVDTPLPSITVNLYRDGQLIATTVTGADGTYLFENLGPGNYTVAVDVNSPGVPGGYSPTINQFNIDLAIGQDYLAADFPFVPLISKTVSAPFAEAGDPLTFAVTTNYPGNTLLSNVTVRDFLPAGTTFTSAGQGGTLTTFISQAGIPGVNPFGATVKRVYAFQGGTTAFWAYNPVANSWATLANAPGTITTGSALTNDGERYVYAFQGGSRAFYRYDAINNVPGAIRPWPTCQTQAAAVTGAGAPLFTSTAIIYASYRRRHSNQFWRYECAEQQSGRQLANTARLFGAGGSLATDGDRYIYALRGDNQTILAV
jgi:uncharacterized repeat protein (TIGR01451 family)